MNIKLPHQQSSRSFTGFRAGISLAIAAIFVMGLPIVQSSTPARRSTASTVSAGDVPAGTSWHQIKPSKREYQRSYESANTYDEARGKVVLFGGKTFDDSLQNDTWTWDGTRWTKETPAVSPPARYGAVMAYDPVLGKAILFGGLDNNLAAMNDTWAWDGSNWTPLNPTAAPPARGIAMMAYDRVNHGVLLFGGIQYPNEVPTLLGDTWIFQGGNWQQLSPVQAPSARGDTDLAYAPANAGLLLFGGASLEGQLNDTWLWNGQTWTQLSPANVPPARIPVLAYHRATSTAVLYLANDFSDPDYSHSETWTWNGTDWTKASGVSPTGNFGEVFVYDAAEKKILFYGGANGNVEQWTWNGIAWTQREPTIPGLRSYASMSFDTSREQSVLFGGEGFSGLLSDTWIWNGRNWNWVHPPISPPVRAWASMAYDSFRGVTVLFGGRTCSLSSGLCDPLNDTWTFDGAEWIQKFSAGVSPSAREGAMMAFDSASGKMVLFGGVDVFGSDEAMGDTWTWDGTTWTEEHPPTNPPATFYAAMSHDSAGSPILFTFYGDTWRWNGVIRDWEAVVTAFSPPTRFAAGMGFDAGTGNIILFGGLDLNTGEFLNDTWAFDGVNWQQLAPANSPGKRYFPAMSDGSINTPPTLMGGYGDGSTINPEREAWTWGRHHFQH